MTEALLLDTHVWLWFTEDSRQIPSIQRERIALAADEDVLYLSAYSLFEVAYAAQRGRMLLKMPLDDWFANALRDPSPRIVPLSPIIAFASTTLPPGFHSDPGDRIIAATAKELGMTLCTHDRALLRIGDQGAYKFLEI